MNFLFRHLIIVFITGLFLLIPQTVYAGHIISFEEYFTGIKEKVDSIIEGACKQSVINNPSYNAKFVHASFRNKLDPKEKFKVEVFLLNTGNMIWFGDKSVCKSSTPFRLGTFKDHDRKSVLWENLTQEDKAHSSWLSGNRIVLKNEYVKPGEIGRFEFDAVAPAEEGIYYEFFAPVIETHTWIEDNEIKLRFHVGQITDEDRKKLKFMLRSRGSRSINLDDINVLLDISDQEIYLRIGEEVLYTFPISSGTYKTPTPIGESKIYFKQKLRISRKTPHYIMPYYMAFRPGGAYGFHELPSLGNDRGAYWREAFSHIGQRRSHGCVRLLPDDVKVVWDFVDIGTKVEVRN